MSAGPVIDLFWFREAKRAHAEAEALTRQLREVRGLWYGACASRTEKAVELAALRKTLADLEATVLRLQDHGP